jgi:hypothetical protein
MSQIAQENATKIAATERLGMMGTYEVLFYLGGTGHQQKRELLQNVPFEAKKATIALKEFFADFTGNTSHELGRFEVGMSLDGLIAATCSMGLIEHKHERDWQGRAIGIVTYYG